MAHWYDFWLKT